MTKIYKLSAIQVIYIIVVCRIITIYAALPEIKTPPANQDMWIVQILSVIYTFIISAPLLFLSNRFSDMTPVQYSQKIMGKFLGRLSGMLFTAFMAFIALMHLVQFIGFLGGILLADTPPYIIILFMLASCSYAAFMGIEVIGRVSEIFVPVILLAIVLFVLLSINNMDLKVFLPILVESDLFQINFGALSIASRFSDLIIFCMLIPCFSEKEGKSSSINRAFIIIVIVFTIFFIIIIMSTQSVLGVDVAKHEQYPFYEFTSEINVYDFIQNIQSINVVAWGMGAFIKFSVYLYCVSVGIVQVFNKKNNKIFIIPIAAVLFMLTLTTKVRKSVVASEIFSFRVIPNIIFAAIFVMPLVLLIIYLFRRKSITINNSRG